MSDLLEVLQALQNTPIPNLLVIAGFVFLFLAFVGRFGAFISLPQRRQLGAGIIGMVLLLSGMGLFMVPSPSSGNTDKPTIPPPTVSPPTVPPTPIPELVLEEWSVSPAEIVEGQVVTIRWKVSNAESVILQPFGNVDNVGQIQDKPHQTKTYTLVANNKGKTLQRSQEVFVTPLTALTVNPPFAVTNVTASVAPASSSSCPTTFNFLAIITANRDGTVTYIWERSDGARAPIQNLTFGNAGSQTVNTTWRLSGSYPGWQRVRILTPNELVSNRATFTLNCPTALPIPETYKTGSLDIPQTWLADLDEGVLVDLNNRAAADIWFEAVTASERYVTPWSGVMIAKVGTTSVGYYGCKAAGLSTNRININNLPVGTYVCVRTASGRYSQFLVNAPVGPSPGTLHIGFTTWANP